jgi:hypothetical protein
MRYHAHEEATAEHAAAGELKAPGKQTLTARLHPRMRPPPPWSTMVTALTGGAATVEDPFALHLASAPKVQRQETSPDRGDELTPAAVRAELLRITRAANAIKRAVDPSDPTLSKDGLPPGQGTAYVTELRALVKDADRVHGNATGELADAWTTTQDALVAAYQMLTVYYADQALMEWSDASEEDQDAQRQAYHDEAGNPDPTTNWCGMFAAAQLRAGGMAGAMRMSFNSEYQCREFFTYGTGWSYTPTTIRPFKQGEPIPIKDYHTQRGAPRSWLAATDAGGDLRPGDIVLLDWTNANQSDRNDHEQNLIDRADHIVIVRSWDPATRVLVTIDGNVYAAKKHRGQEPGFDGTDDNNAFADAPDSDVGTSRYEAGSGGNVTLGAQNVGAAFNREEMMTDPTTKRQKDTWKSMTLMGRGRPSVVDYEEDHEYQNDNLADPVLTGPKTAAGPIEQKVQRREAGSATPSDPAGAFAAATSGASGAIPYRDEMQARFGADFGGVAAHVGRDLSALHAHAATQGEAVVFASATPDRETVAHELTHVLQARQGREGGGALSDPGDASEHEARSVASSFASGGSLEVGAAPSAAIHRREEVTPPPVYPAIGMYSGALDWDSFSAMTKQRLPYDPRDPTSVRDRYHMAMEKQLADALPAEFGALYVAPAEDDTAGRAAAIDAVCRAVVELQRAALTRGDRGEAERLRVGLFIANEHAIVDALQSPSSARYVRKPKGWDGKTPLAGRTPQLDDDTFCNVYAYDLVTSMGAYLPREWWTDDAAQEIADGRSVSSTRVVQQSANDLGDWLEGYGERYGWARLGGAEAAQQTANAGFVVVIVGDTDLSNVSGHITVVLAESKDRKRPNADVPLQSQAGATNFLSNKAGATDLDSSATIAWWTDPKFATVGFWAYRGPARGKPPQAATQMGLIAPSY